MKSLIVIAHGSKKKISNNEVLDIVDQIKTNKTQYSLIEPAFLEFATPSIEQSVEKSIEKNILNIFIYPYFLNSGKHVTADIPNVIKKMKVKYPKAAFTILPHFGQSNQINKIILSDTNI